MFGPERRGLEPADLPLIEWARLPVPDNLCYEALLDRFYCCGRWVHLVALRSIVGLPPYQRDGAFLQTHEEAARRYFQHEAFLFDLTPAPRAPTYDSEDD